VRVSKDHLFVWVWPFYVMIAVISVSTCLPIDFLRRLIQLAWIFGHFLFELRFGDIKSLNQVAVLHTSAIELYRIEKKINLVDIITSTIHKLHSVSIISSTSTFSTASFAYLALLSSVFFFRMKLVVPNFFSFSLNIS
jgi:hypothetical protein